MGRVFLSAGRHHQDSGIVAFGTTEAQEATLTRDLVEAQLQSEKVNYVSVPNTLNERETLDWINQRALPNDIAIEIRLNQLNGIARGAEVYYLAGNETRQQSGELLLTSLLETVPELPNRGVKPDSLHPLGELPFCRQIIIPSVVMGLGFIDNRHDLALLLNYRQQFAKGLAKGLKEWSQQATATPHYPIFNIYIKDWQYPDNGVAINQNPYIPLDLVENLAIGRENLENLRRINYGNVVYIKAVDLQPYNISVRWDGALNAVILKPAIPDGLEEIMGFGQASEEQLGEFLTRHNPQALTAFPHLPQLYLQEAEAEGINSDLAFCQMCMETNFLTFGGNVKPEQNNFANLGGIGGNVAGASFQNIEMGVKAHIQHLKGYASVDMINNPPVVDPRFELIPRGVAATAYDLGGRWNADLDYGKKIMAMMRQLYENTSS